MTRNLSRRIAGYFGRLSGSQVIDPDELHLAHERAHLRRFFAEFGVDCVFDVGANAGQYATMLRQHVGFRGAIISYEPIPELAEELRRIASGDPAWHVEAVALDREVGPAVFHVMADTQFSSLHKPAVGQPDIFAAKNSVARDVPVMRATLADELPKWQQRLGFARPFLKMDTQGNDLAVALGAGDALRRFVGLQSELAIRKLYAGSTGFAECIAAYAAQGFELSAFVPNNAGHFPMLVEVDCIMFNRAMAQTDREGTTNALSKLGAARTYP
ncbi:MAG TPA: FkbM family methyltransferase [Stellaceae bacterium]|nr:FkbM family methyltransferase [Stellaceae bacterium]